MSEHDRGRATEHHGDPRGEPDAGSELGTRGASRPVDLALAVVEPEQAALDAGLRYVRDVEAGLRRRRCGRGFTYLDAAGNRVRDPDQLTRIAELAIPPAWTDVWICADPKGHLQATGRDQRGRKQYRYHPRWRTVRDAHKFERLPAFGAGLSDLRARVDADLDRPGLPRERVVAAVVALLDETLIRIGNPEYAADNETYGLTTLRSEHADVGRRRVELTFVG